MKLDDFNALSDEEKSGLLSGMETDRKTIEDLTAERDSFKTENTQLQSQIEQANKELKATKESTDTRRAKKENGFHTKGFFLG